jgi:hypothetical protein
MKECRLVIGLDGGRSLSTLGVRSSAPEELIIGVRRGTEDEKQNSGERR